MASQPDPPPWYLYRAEERERRRPKTAKCRGCAVVSASWEMIWHGGTEWWHDDCWAEHMRIEWTIFPEPLIVDEETARMDATGWVDEGMIRVYEERLGYRRRDAIGKLRRVDIGMGGVKE